MIAAIVVLGCRVRSRGAGTLERRVGVAARDFHAGSGGVVIASGGRVWDGVMEADRMAELLEALGVPAASIVRERCSFDTHQNALYSSAILMRRGLDRVRLVTCEWHLPRALAAFAHAGIEARGVPVLEPAGRSRMRVAVRAAREWCASIAAEVSA